MTILEDSKKMGKPAVWEKWEQISNYDMRPREKQFLSAVVSDLRHLKSMIYYLNPNKIFFI